MGSGGRRAVDARTVKGPCYHRLFTVKLRARVAKKVLRFALYSLSFQDLYKKLLKAETDHKNIGFKSGW
ncbi:hypothetical protein Peur_032771 [Populus x canadensis]